MAIRPKEVFGDELTEMDKAHIRAWVQWIDDRLNDVRFLPQKQEGLSETAIKIHIPKQINCPISEIELYLWSQRHGSLIRLPEHLIPFIEQLYSRVGWIINWEARKQGKVSRKYLILQPRQLRLLTNAPIQTERGENISANDKAGYVYLLEAENGLYKIGRSKRPHFRISEITKAVAPFEIKAVHTAYYPDCYAAESELHMRFKKKRKRGEWFALSPQDVKAVIEHSYEAA